MTPHEFTKGLMDKLWLDGFFEKAILSRELLAAAVLKCSIHNNKCDGTCKITEEQLEHCILQATEAYIDLAIEKFSEMGLINMAVKNNGTMVYQKSVCRARQLGYM